MCEIFVDITKFRYSLVLSLLQKVKENSNKTTDWKCILRREAPTFHNPSLRFCIPTRPWCSFIAYI